MKTVTLYGIPNCDTVRKARKWLADSGVEHNFIDLREAPPTRVQVTGWLKSVGPERLINRRSTTFRQLSDADRSTLDGSDAANVLIAHPTLIKRPVLEWQDHVSVGFTTDDFSKRFAT